MNICLVTPAPPRSYGGNRVTAERWAGFVRELGHDVALMERYDDRPYDLLIVLHARRSAPSIRRFRELHPTTPLVLALTGTDLYRDLGISEEARRSLQLADRFVVLQRLGRERLPAPLRDRVRVIHQSVEPLAEEFPALKDRFEVAVLAHLRPVKDPFRSAEAARRLPAASHVRVLHLGAELERGYAERARAQEAINPRYRWLGGLPRHQALRVLARSRLLALTSELEGGANVVSEAIAYGVPVVSSHIDGSIGLLGDDYPGYYPVGDTEALADLLWRCETDHDGLRTELTRRVGELADLVDPAREREAWKALLAELT